MRLASSEIEGLKHRHHVKKYCKSGKSCYFMVWFWLQEAKWGWYNKVYTVTNDEVGVKRIIDISVDI